MVDGKASNFNPTSDMYNPSDLFKLFYKMWILEIEFGKAAIKARARNDAFGFLCARRRKDADIQKLSNSVKGIIHG